MAEIVFNVDLSDRDYLKAFKKHQDDVVRAIGQALVGAAEAAMLLSKSIYVPVITGTLRSTGTVGALVISQGVLSVELSYGGPAAPYAQAVHNAPPDRGQGKAQYLYLPFMDVGRTLDRRVKAQVQPLLR